MQFMNYIANNMELTDWLTVKNRCGKLNLFRRIRVKSLNTVRSRYTLVTGKKAKVCFEKVRMTELGSQISQ